MERNKHKNMATTMLLAVVLIFVTQVDSSDMGIDSLGSHCPEGTVFCMQTFQCVNSLTPYTDPCPVSPDCKRNEVKQWSHLGYEQCLDHKIACGTYVCKHDGVLQCDYSGTCDRIEVSFTLSTPYDVFVDTPELVEDRIITQLSAAAGISPDAIWTLEIPADYYDPSVTIVKCNMSAETKSSVEELFAREDQIFVDANGLPVSVDWTMSWWQYHEAWGQYYDYGNDNEDYQGIVCGPDEVFCFLTFSCVKSDGLCPENKHCGEGMEECFYMNGTYSCVIPGKCHHDEGDYDYGDDHEDYPGIICGPNEVFCFETFSCRPSSGACPEIEDCYPGTEKCLKSDGTFDCVGVGQCNRVEVIITFNIYDFYGFVGSDYMNYDQQIEAITNSLIPADDIHYGMLWNPVLWQGNDSLIHFHCWAVEDLFDMLSSSIKANSLQLYDMNGQSISELINWSESKVYVQCGYRHEKCLQSDGTYVCVEEGQCNHVEVIITFNFYDFYGFVGSDYMNYDQQIEAITNSLIPAGDIHYGMLWNPVLWQGHDGLIHFHCWAVEDLFDFLSSSIKANSLQLSDMSGQSITGLINWSESTAYVQCGYRHQTCYQYGTIQCVDSLTCRHVEVYLVFNANEAISAALGSITYYDKLSMVIQSLNANIGNIAGDNMFWNATLWEDNGATHFHCWAAEELNDALMELSTKGVYDVILSEVNWEESAIWLQDYSGGNYHDYHDYDDGDEKYEGMGIECDPNEIFCFESNTCYNPDDPCSPDEPNICADGMEQCHDGTSQICVPLDTCEIIIVTIGLNVNYEDLVGVLSENYDTLVTALQMSLASQVGQPDIFWNINIGPASDTVTVFHATTSVAWYELVNQIITSEMLDVGLPINWEYTSVYNPYATTTDSFLLRFTVDLPEDNSISVTDVIEQHETIKTLVRYQVENAVGFGKLSTLVYYPAALYSTSMTVYAELNNIEFNVQQLLDDLVSANGISLNIYDVNIITLPASSTNIYVLSAPVVANEEKSFSIEQVVSVGDVTSIGLFDCSATIDLQVKTGTLAYGSSVDVSKSDIITLKHSLTESAFVSCSVNFEGDEYFVGFLAIPYDITQMGEIEDISLTQESLDINEDSDWTEVPSGIISSSMKGEHLYYMFNTWHEAMISNHERWINFETETSLLSIFEDNALELFRAMLSNIESFRATVTTDLPLVNNVPTIQFRYRSKVSDEYTPMDETTGVNMLLDSNLVSFKLKENYFGEFLLTISDVDRDLNLLLPVYVSEMFDRPTLNTDINRFEGNTDFAYPYEAQMSVPTYSVGDIVSIPFQNVDGYAMGMSVLGYVKSDTTITGTWEYSNDAGFTWNEINEAMPDGNFQIYATLLNADDMIRFTPQPDVNWSIYKAPRLAFYAVEDTDEISNVVDTITFSECSVFADEEISRYCMNDERPSYSDDFVVLPLARYDCNGDLNEGMLELACGCGDATSCLDCGGVANGGQVEDICGDCGGTLTAINCTIEICSINRADFCDYISNVPDDSSGNACEDGYILRCGGCYLENEFLDEPCGVCGFDHCLDCNGVPDGTSLPNLCGGCSAPDMLSSDCATGIGNIQPAFVLYSEVDVFSMNVTYPVSIEGFSCDLVSVENGDSISLSINSYDTLDSNTYVSSMTLLYDTTDKSTLIGKYNVVCDTGSETITSIEQFVVYGFPTVTSITPALADITELSYSYDITILGSGFVDTGAIYCIVPCSELDFDCDIPYVGAEGKFISESSVSCPVGKYKRYFRGQTYHVSVVLFDLESYLEMGNDISPDIELSNVEFTVTVPAPVAVSAVADKHGCEKIVVTFDIAVVVDTDDPSKCNDFLPDFDETARCKMMPDGDRNIVITYTGDTPSIESISVSNNKIKNADDKSNTPIYFTGSIPLTIGALSPSEQPIVEIAGSNSVGCFGTELKPVFKNLGCWEPVITWSVISDSIDTTLTDGLIIDQNKIVQYITPDKLYDGVTYTFTMNYVVGDVTGSKSIELSKGADAIPTLEFFGVNDKFDTTHSNVMKAYVYQCGNSLNANLKIDWFVKDVSTDTDILQGSGKTFNIQAHKLNSDYNYEITCTLTYSGGILVSTKTFSTASVPIDAKIYVDGINVQSKEMIANTEFYLACDDAKAADYDLSKYSCIWLCETNQYTDGESYLPCFDTDGNVWYEDGLTVTVPATPTENIPPHEYVRIFYLSMYRGETDPSYSEMKITYRPTPDTVKEPELEIRSETHYEIIDKNAEITINVLCSKATRYSWQFNDGENGYGKPIMLIDQNGPLSGDISYHENKASECGMTLDLSNVDMVPEFQYYIKLTVDNQQPPYGRTESQIFTFKIMDIPVAGSLEVFSSEDPPIASTTSFKLVMYRWSEDVNFKCFCYYRSVYDYSVKRINAIQVSPSVGIPQFYLPEGEFDFRVDCIDDYGYSVSASSGTTITVQSQPPIDTSTFTASMELLPFHVSIEIETVITTVSSSVGLYNSVVGSGDSSIGSSEIESAHNILYQSTNIAISTAIDICYDDQISLVVVLEMSVDLVIQAGPTLIASSTKIKIVATAANIAYSALGYQDFGRRRKREVNTPSTAAGLDLETATSILNVFDTFLVNDTLDATIAEDIGDAIDDIMKGLSMGYSGVTRIEAVSDEIYISVYKTDMTGLDTAQYDISSDTVSSNTIPGKVVFGPSVTDSQSDTWSCVYLANCTSIFIGVGIVTEDVYSRAIGVDAPTRISDIYIERLIDTLLFTFRSLDNLDQPIETTIFLYQQVNETAYNPKCMMWLDYTWDQSVCSTSDQAFDSETASYYVVCSCTQLGVLAVFQELKEMESLSITTTTTTTTSTTTSTTTPPLPSVSLQQDTDFVFMTFSFVESFFDFLTSDAVEQAAFTEHIEDQFVALTSYPPNSFQNWHVEEGSIVVSFDLYQSGSGQTLGQMVYVIEDLFSSGNITLTAPNGTVLTIIPGSFAYQEKSNSDGSSDDSSDDSSNSAALIGGIVAGVIIAILIAVIVILVLKQKGIIKIGSSSPHDDPPPRYEMPSPSFNVMPARPPPYLYDPVKQTKEQKWIENEVEKKVAEIKKEEEKRPISSSSGGKQETGLPIGDELEKENTVPSVSP